MNVVRESGPEDNALETQATDCWNAGRSAPKDPPEHAGKTQCFHSLTAALRSALGTGFLLLWAGCAVGPNYKRPALEVPRTFRGEITSGTNSLADLPWWKLFEDVRLQR